jgi:hypothetical protein
MVDLWPVLAMTNHTSNHSKEGVMLDNPPERIVNAWVRKRLVPRWALAAALALALILTGCSNDNSATRLGPVSRAAMPAQQNETTENQRQEDAFTPVIVTLISGDTAAVRGTDGRYHVVYELMLTDTKQVPASIEAVEVLDATNGTQILRLDAEEALLSNLRALDTRPVEDTSLPPNESRLLFLQPSFESEAAVPDALDHWIEALAAAGPAATEPSPVSY